MDDAKTIATDCVNLGYVRRMAALLNRDPGSYQSGSVIPAHWYQILFTPLDLTCHLGPDGHAETRFDGVPEEFSTRMFGGRRTIFNGCMKAGMDVSRTSSVKNRQPKEGRQGPIYLITVQHHISSASKEFEVIEEQDIIYRKPSLKHGSRINSKPKTLDLPASDSTREWTPTTQALFRYSAITFNSHKIHYDGRYATEVEGHPSLIVNGGLTNLMLSEFASEMMGQSVMTSESRNHAPLYVDRPVRLNIAAQSDHVLLWACDEAGNTAVQMKLKLGSAS